MLRGLAFILLSETEIKKKNCSPKISFLGAIPLADLFGSSNQCWQTCSANDSTALQIC